MGDTAARWRVPAREANRPRELTCLELGDTLTDIVQATATADLSSIDLFAGCGGLSLGLHRAGWKGLFAIERDPMAFESLATNLVGEDSTFAAYNSWPAWVPQAAQDIDVFLADAATRRRLRSLRGSVTLVAGGPPCQGFSVGGARNGEDERNHLVHRLLDVVGLVRPKIAMIENVEGITRPFRSRPRPGEPAGSVASEVVAAFSEMGYRAAFGVVDASRFGVPQVRRRAIIIGVLEETSLDPSDFFRALERVRAEHLAAHGLPADRPVTAREALQDLLTDKRVVSPDSPKFESSEYQTPESAYAQELRGARRDGTVPDSHRYSVHGERVLSLYQAAHSSQAPGRLSKEFLLAMGTKKDKKVLIDPDAPVSTITTHPDEFIHYAEPRNVTVREMARLQSFPDDFEFRGRYTINGPRRRFDVARCSQVGNAVPPLLAEAVGRALREFIGA